MKIVYLSPSGELGGAEKSLIDILASLSSARPDWTLRLVAGEDGPLLSFAKASKVFFVRRPGIIQGIVNVRDGSFEPKATHLGRQLLRCSNKLPTI